MATKQKAANTSTADTKQTVLATLPEMVPTQQDGVALLDFFHGVAAFFNKAHGLEQRAKQTLLDARMLTPPQSAEDDEQIQLFIKRATADAKEVEGHWEVTAIISRFHKRLTGARSRATSPISEAKDIAQRLHNRYVDEARRKAAEEQERLRREMEQQAAAAKQRELDALEARALEVEAGSADLSEREQQFVYHFVGSRNPIESARRAGFKNPESRALKLLQSQKIIDAIHAREASHSIREQAKALEQAPTVIDVPEVKAEVGTLGSDRTTHTAEVVDLEAWRAGILAGTIPIDTAIPSQPKLNEYARSLRTQINRFPGVRYKATTRTV